MQGKKLDKKELAKELADVLNVLLRLADVLDIDLIHWFDQKMIENEEWDELNSWMKSANRLYDIL